MQKKLFLNRNLPSQEKSSHVKILLWAALGLVVLMVLVLNLPGKKGAKNGLSRSNQEKSGAVVREIPKSLGGVTEGGQQLPPLVSESKEATDVNVAPIPDMKSFSDSQAKTPTGDAETASGRAPEMKKLDALANVAPAKVQPDQTSSGDSAASQAFKVLDGGVPPSGKSAPDAAKAVAPPVANKPVPAKSKTAGTLKPGEQVSKVSKGTGSELFTVQVGSFHEKKYADELQQSLKKKGYSVSIKAKPDPKDGQLFVVLLEPVSDLGRAHTLVAQIQHEEKVKPFILKVQAGE